MDAPENDDRRARELVSRYADLILRLSYTRLKSTHDAEDICQTVLLKLLLQPKPFENAEHEKAWVIRATLNACKDLLKSGWRKRRVDADPELRAQAQRAVENTATAASCADFAEQVAEYPSLRSPVLEAVMALPANYREAIYLHYYEGYSAREIAQLTGRSESAVNAHLSRGRKKLKTLLQGDNYAF